MTLLGWLVIVAGALALGIVAQVIWAGTISFRWVITAIGAFAGAAVTSEWFFSGTTPEYEGMAVWPALVGGLVVGIVVDVAAHWIGSTMQHGGIGRGAPVH